MGDIYKWAKNEVELACKNTTDNYAIMCYQSALKAFKSLCEDEHSGCSIGITMKILNELTHIRPLTPIEDTPDVWDCVTENADRKLMQCKRMSSLFKTVYSDGRITYSDIDRCRCKTVVGNSYYYSKEAIEIIDKLFPITMPYLPKDRYIFMVDEIEPEPGELLGTAYLKLLKNGSQVEDFKPIYILNGEEVDKEAWMREKETHNDNN